YKEQLATLEALLPQAQVYAIGEIGLDYYWDTTFQTEQIEAFKHQLCLADSLDLPVILHIREAFADAFKVLRELNLPKLRGVFHSFTGTQEELEEALTFANFYVGINGVLTFKNSNLKDYVTLVPQERLLIETDAPYLAPVPKRGKRNEPSFLPYTLSFLASCYEMSDEKLMHITSDNTRRLFHLPTR
ncbi:MAG: TatD family hydrolase, partial [Porphyromonadaceae bacterium]|nr:TatD family hydrolase [Porphyromonadaceae bacterium]